MTGILSEPRQHAAPRAEVLRHPPRATPAIRRDLFQHPFGGAGMRRHQIQQLDLQAAAARQLREQPPRRVGIRRHHRVPQVRRRMRPEPLPEPLRHLRDPMNLPTKPRLQQPFLPLPRLPARARHPLPHQIRVQTRRQSPPQPPPTRRAVPKSARIRHRAQHVSRHPNQTRHPRRDLTQQTAQPPHIAALHRTGVQRRRQRQQPAPSPLRAAQGLQHPQLRLVAQHPAAPAAHKHPTRAVHRHHPTPRSSLLPAVHACARPRRAVTRKT